MQRSPKMVLFWVSFLIGLLIDQATKIWAYTTLELHVDEMEVIPGFLSFKHAQNPGAAFSMLADFGYRNEVFLIFTAVAIVFIVQMYRQLGPAERLLPFALGLILSGAVGNAIDRIHKGTVTDFIKVYSDEGWLRNALEFTIGSNEWPTFNIADSSLLIGVVLFFIHGMIYGDVTDKPDGDADADADTVSDAGNQA